MEYLQKILKKSGQASIVESIIFAILGIILIANPEETVKVISYILGAGLIIVGIFQILNYIKMNGQSDLYNYHLIYGIRAIKSNIWIYTLIMSVVMFCCGLYIVLNQGTIVVTVGVLMVVYAIMDIIENIIFLRNIKQL